ARSACTTTHMISISAAATYTLSITYLHGALAISTRTLTVNANPVAAITGNNIICSGSSSTFDAGAGFSSYAWSTGATTQTISVSAAGRYTVTVTHARGCSGSVLHTLTLNANPVAA